MKLEEANEIIDVKLGKCDCPKGEYKFCPNCGVKL